MKKYLLFFSLLLIGCGARKVQKSETEQQTKTEISETVNNDVKAESNVKKETKITVDDSTKEVIEEIIISPIDNNKEATYTDEAGKQTKLSNTSVTKRKTNRNKAVSQQTQEKANESLKSSDKTVKNTNAKSETKEVSEIKNVDKKQFNIIGQILSYWWLWLLIIIVIYLFKKYREKIWFV